MVLLASVVVSILSAFLFWRYITETLDQAVIKERRAAPGGIGSLRELGSMPRNVWVMTIVAGLSAFAVRITFSFTVIYAVEVIGLTKTEYGAIGTAVSLVSTFLTFPGGILADRIGKKTTIVVSRVLSAFSTLGITYAGISGSWAPSGSSGASPRGWEGPSCVSGEDRSGPLSSRTSHPPRVGGG